jgi:hypothetical protein
MGHCAVDALDDLAECLGEIRTWPAVREPKPGVLYVKRTPFLHFHMNAAGERWADARNGADWRQHIAIPRGASAVARRRFVRDVRRCYRATARLSGV